MGNETSAIDQPITDSVSERKLRGAGLNGAELKGAADHSEYETERNPDTELHLDGETDTLFDDGIDVEEKFDTLAGTDGSSGTIP